MSQREQREETESKSRSEAEKYLQVEIDRINKTFSMSYKDNLALDSSRIPYGFEYRYGRESCLNQPDSSRIAFLMGKGWTYVPADRHPELSAHVADGIIRNRGLVLLQRPKLFGKRETEAVNKHNWEVQKDMPSLNTFMGDPSIPASFISDPTPFKGPSGF